MALSSSDVEYEVEKIIKHRKRGGVTEYYVTWIDFDESEDQWVKESDIHASALLEQYKKNMNTKGKSMTKKTMSKKMSKADSTKAAKQGSVKLVKEDTVILRGSQKSNSYDYVENDTSDVQVLDAAPVLIQRSSQVSRSVVQESGDTAATLSETSDVELDTPLVTRHSSSQVSRTVFMESGDKARNVTLLADGGNSLSASTETTPRQKSLPQCELLSLMIFVSCFLFAIGSIIVEKREKLQFWGQ